jgi:MFS family permease
MTNVEAVAPSVQFRRLAVLLAANFVDMVGFMIVIPLLPFYALDLNASPVVIGWIISAFPVAQLLSAPAWGRVSDHYGRRPAILIGLTASAVAYVVFGLATSIWLLFVSRIIQGLGGGTVGVLHAYVADMVGPEQRARALGWVSAATSAGVMVGPALGSFAANLGQEGPGFVAAGLCLINVFFAWKWLPESRPSSVRSAATKRPPVWHTAVQVLRHPGRTIPRLIWIYAVGMLAFTSLTAVFSLFFEAEFAITARTIGYFFFYIGALSFIMRSIVLGPIVERIGEGWAMRLGATAMAIGLVLYPLMPNLTVLLLVMPLVPIGTALLFPSTTSLMSRYAPEGDLGATMGTAQAFAGLSRVAAPLFATYLFQRLGHGTPFFAAAAILMLVTLLTLGVATTTPRPARITEETA